MTIIYTTLHSKSCGKETSIADFIYQSHVKIASTCVYNIMILCVHVVSLHRVVEIREGQKTETFDRVHYERAKNRSFSLIYQKEGEPVCMHVYKSMYLCIDCPLTSNTR